MCCVGITTHGDLVMKIQHVRPEILHSKSSYMLLLLSLVATF